MMRHIMLCIGICSILTGAAFGANPRKELENKQKELEVLRTFLDNARDSLQQEIKSRWSTKQQFVEQRKIDKQEMEDLRHKQEQAYNNLSRIKEECFAKERQIEDEQKTLEEKQKQWQFVASSFEEVFDKEQKRIAEAFPLDMESRRKSVNELQRRYSADKSPAKILPAFTAYYADLFEKDRTIAYSNQVVMPDGSSPERMRVVRFGDVLAYAVNNDGDVFTVRQTGRLGAARFKVEQVGSEELTTFVRKKMPQWISQGTIEDGVLMDVMLNPSSKKLVAGTRVKTSTKIAEWFKAGGVIMYPLVGLLVWALVLVALKLLQYSRKHRNTEKMSREVLQLLKKGERAKALEYSRNHKGVVARVVSVVIDRSEVDRSSAEKSVKEILLEEVPLLNRHLATLGVIAGAAPLLGLLGTVTGMIHLFTVITQYGTSDPKILAGGISEALVTTQTGLSIAIPILLIHNALRNRSQSIQNEMQTSAMRVLNRIQPAGECER